MLCSSGRTASGCSSCGWFDSCRRCFDNRYIYYGLIVGCTACSNKLSYCRTCSSDSNCLSCLDNTACLSGGRCSLCATPMPGCQTCSSCSYCLGLVDNQYFMQTNNQPEACSTFQEGCQTCTANADVSVFTCHSCLSGYQMNSTGHCFVCSSVMSHCSTCLNETNCTDCVVTYYVLADTTGCGSCTVLDYCYDCVS